MKGMSGAAFIRHDTLRKYEEYVLKFSSVQSLICVLLFTTPWTAAHQAFLSIPSSWNLLKLMSIESVMPSNPLIPNNKSRLEQEDGGASREKIEIKYYLRASVMAQWLRICLAMQGTLV